MGLRTPLLFPISLSLSSLQVGRYKSGSFDWTDHGVLMEWDHFGLLYVRRRLDG